MVVKFDAILKKLREEDAGGVSAHGDLTGVTVAQHHAKYTDAEAVAAVDLSGKANIALDNLASVAINTSLISDTDSTDDLGSSDKYWANTFTDILLLNSTATLDGATAGLIKVTGRLSIPGIGTNNEFIGVGAGNASITGQANAGLGLNVFAALTSGSFNMAIGSGVLSNNTAGERNTGIGAFAMDANIGGSNNVALGQDALGANTSGGNNIAMGNFTLLQNTAGFRNTAIGQSALENTTASNNLAVGFQAGKTHVSGSNNIFIGYQAGFFETASNKLFIDNASRASEADARVKALIYGVFAAATADQNVTMNAVVNTVEHYEVAATQVVGARVVDARVDDAINSGDATTDGVIDALRDAMITHGLIAAT